MKEAAAAAPKTARESRMKRDMAAEITVVEYCRKSKKGLTTEQT